MSRLLALLAVQPAELPSETAIIKAVGARAFSEYQGEINQFMVSWKVGH